MNVPASAPNGAVDEPSERPADARPSRAELDRIFGTEPTSTRDDLPDPEPPRAADTWYLENRPPHHGG